MKRLIIKSLGLIIAIITMSSCEDFVDINRSPATISEVDPETFLYEVELCSATGSEWYDAYACKLRWVQYCANIWGYSTTNFTYFTDGIGSGVYNDYIDAGSYMKHMEYYVNENMPEQADKYKAVIEMARILFIFKGLYATDMHGSLIYSEGFSLRSGGDNNTPKYDTQEELFTKWDSELKNSISILQSATNQIDISGYDQVYGGDQSKWVKAANALRLRIALRWLKRDPEKAKSIAAEVLSGSIFSSTDDSFILYMDYKQGQGHDYQSIGDMDRASIPFMRYLNKYNDPRRRIFFKPNNCTPENIALYNETHQDDPIPTTVTRWEGGTVSYDYRTTDVGYKTRDNLNGLSMRVMCSPQVRLWYGADNSGSAGQWYPLITYADFCLMASEFVLDGVSSDKSAKEWYEEGLRASLKQWSEIGAYCAVENYEAITDEEINTFLAQEGIAWDESIAKEQIYCQFWVESFKNNNEGWCNWRRTGYPNETSTIVTFDPVMVNGEKQRVPRRKQFSYPLEGSTNYENVVESIQTMASDPEFGDIDDEFGRFWWDKE